MVLKEKEQIEEKLIEGKQIVIAKFPEGHCLTFLVDDVEKPQVPGCSARALTYFDNIKEAREGIERVYKKLNYRPKNCVKGYFVPRKRHDE